MSDKDKEVQSSNLVVVAFDGHETAARVLKDLQALEVQGDIVLEDAVVVERREGTQVELKQGKSKEWKPTGSGAAIGFVAGLLVGGPIVGTMLGAGVGYLAGRMRDHGIEDDFIKEVSASLTPDSSAVFLLVRGANAENVLATLENYHGRILKSTLDADQEERLRNTLR